MNIIFFLYIHIGLYLSWVMAITIVAFENEKILPKTGGGFRFE